MSFPDITASGFSDPVTDHEKFAFLAPAERPGDLGCLADYYVVGILGEGGMGLVLEGVDKHLRRPVAIKIIRPGQLTDALLERFLREAQAAANLQHESIVTIHQVGQFNGAPFLTMERLLGRPLDQLLLEGPLPLLKAVRIGREVAEGLMAAHEMDVIHRDVKPANIWVQRRGRCKLLDFGIARLTTDGQGITSTGAILGTPAYMAPEQARGEHVGPSADLFSLGCVLYELTTGRLPFPGNDFMAILLSLATTTPPAPVKLNSAIPTALSQLITGLLQKKVEQRPSQAAEVAAELAKIEAVITRQDEAWNQSTVGSILRGLGGWFEPRRRPGRSLAGQSSIDTSLKTITSTPKISDRKSTGSKAADHRTPSAAEQAQANSLGGPGNATEARTGLRTLGVTAVIGSAVAVWFAIAGGWLPWPIDLVSQKPPAADDTVVIAGDEEVVSFPTETPVSRERESQIVEISLPSAEDLRLESLPESPDEPVKQIEMAAVPATPAEPEPAVEEVKEPVVAVVITPPVPVKLPITKPQQPAKPPQPMEPPPAVGKSLNPPSVATADMTQDPFEGAQRGQVRADNILQMTLVWCPAGKFKMGSPKTEKEHQPDEDQVEVSLSRGFWLGRTEVTQAEWKQVLQTTPWKGQVAVQEGDNFPATYVSWEDANSFCQKLTAQERQRGLFPEGWQYDLPTEAQWEYACRAGTTTAYSFGNEANRLSEHGWWGGLAGNGNAKVSLNPPKVGQKRANPWGLQDMHGNVFEWCRDWYGKKMPGGRDPEVIGKGTLRVARGGSWVNEPANCRSANRGNSSPSQRDFNKGFRVALVPLSQQPQD